MTKLKLSLPSGNEVEKPVISYFNNGGNYLVLDAESIGSMGLPIILVSKVNNGKVEKIIDQNEWQQVKGYLKSIISGSPTTYLSIPESIAADETYYTQLTLPVASFDTLKNSYVVPGTAPGAVTQENSAPEAIPNVTDIPASENVATPVENSAEQPIVESDNTVPVIDTPTVSETPVSTNNNDEMTPVNMATETALEEPLPAVDSSNSNPTDPAIVNPIIGEQPIANEGLNSSEEIQAPEVSSPEVPNIETPTIEEPAAPVISDPVPAENTAIESPVIPDINEQIAPVQDVQSSEPVANDSVIADNVQDSTPIMDSPVISTDNAVVSTNNDIESIKQKFMSACEELFDALSSIK